MSRSLSAPGEEILKRGNESAAIRSVSKMSRTLKWADRPPFTSSLTLISGTWRDFRHIWWDGLVTEECVLHFGKNQGCFLLKRPNVLREDLHEAYKHERKTLKNRFTQNILSSFTHPHYTVLTFLAIKIKRRKGCSFPCRVNWSLELCHLMWNLTNTRWDYQFVWLTTES